MKLNLGCGFKKREGYLNVDKEALCHPDQVVDLEAFPWPWPDDTFSEVLADHTLEHLGETTENWLGIMRELWRVCKNGALVQIAVPHPRHDNFLHDPTHVRIITPVTLAMFDQQRNLENLESGGQETKLGLFTGVDFQVVEAGYDLSDPWKSAYMNGILSREQVEREMMEKNNVCFQIRMAVKIIKPGRGQSWIDRQMAMIRSP